ncbi:hypothetical protein PVL29_021922 [Vitis rotundifolia]|uniref:RNA polymerase Rpb4/RPC9 core domain-containing protein n=1 Tax=Vitis rotundifolia TaxID=103349 RepID=A0AA38YTZ0_VITRO|nr:hypothetical protein PVL29_021922 [Vitis rotundifolia]
MFCRKKANAGALTNFEILDLLRYRGAAKDPTWLIAPIAASEFKAYDYLVESAACNQTRVSINEFTEKCKKYHLLKIIKECEKQTGEEIEDLVEMVMTVLPPPQTQMNLEEEVGVDQKEIVEGDQMT